MSGFIGSLGAVAFLEFLLAAAWARIVAANVLQCVAHRLLWTMVAVRTVDMAMIVMVVVIVVAVGAVDVMLVHAKLLRDVISGNYLAIARHVHALTKKPAGFN